MLEQTGEHSEYYGERHSDDEEAHRRAPTQNDIEKPDLGNSGSSSAGCRCRCGTPSCILGHHSQAFGKTLVVEHDEDDIEEDDKPAQHAYDEADAACDNRTSELMTLAYLMRSSRPSSCDR